MMATYIELICNIYSLKVCSAFLQKRYFFAHFLSNHHIINFSASNLLLAGKASSMLKVPNTSNMMP